MKLDVVEMQLKMNNYNYSVLEYKNQDQLQGQCICNNADTLGREIYQIT